MLANFTAFTRRRAEESPSLPESLRDKVPTGFEAVAEALNADTDPAPACTVVGRITARDGIPLEESLAALRATFALFGYDEPSFGATEALVLAWSEGTLEYLHQMSCLDPMTGLASLPHVRTRLEDIYREADQDSIDVRTTKALVIVETRASGSGSGVGHFSRMLCLARVAETMRTVFPGGETIGQIGSDRVVALVSRDSDLGVSVALLRDLLLGQNLPCGDTRVWIEGLPGQAESATRLLDELAR